MNRGILERMKKNLHADFIADIYASVSIEFAAASADPSYVSPEAYSPSAKADHSYVPDVSRLPARVVERAVEAFEAGKNVLLFGSPGTGKTTLARYLCSLLPLLAGETADEVNTICRSAQSRGIQSAEVAAHWGCVEALGARAGTRECPERKRTDGIKLLRECK